jgi:sugar lactone lactonase YvrE
MTGYEVLLSGQAQGESPRWHDGRLWFANWGTGEIVAVGLDGVRSVVATVDPSTVPYSIDWLPDGRLLVISGPTGQLLVQSASGSWETYADLSGLAGGYNELVVDGRGNAFVNGGDMDFTDPKPGIVAVVTPSGSARAVADGILFGNGMVVTPDDSTLIVAESYGNRLTAFDIAPDGGLSNRRVWASLGDGVPDGICLDASGAVWYADVPNRRCVRVQEGGTVLDTVEVDRGCFACMLGGLDGSTLFINAAQWKGFEGFAEVFGTGQILTYDAGSPHAGRP